MAKEREDEMDGQEDQCRSSSSNSSKLATY